MRRYIALIALIIASLFCTEKVSGENIVANEGMAGDTLKIKTPSGQNIISLLPARDNNNGFEIKVLDQYEFRINANKPQDDDYSGEGMEANNARTLSATENDAEQTNILPERKNQMLQLVDGNIGFIEFGFNVFPSVNYDNYPNRDVNFMDLKVLGSQHWMFSPFTTGLSLTPGANILMSTGLQIGFNTYRLDNKIHIYKDNGKVNYYRPEDYVHRSRLNTFSIQVPIMFDMKLAKDFYLSAGAYGGVNIAASSVVKHPRIKVRDPYIAPFYGGLSAHLTYDWFYVFCNYNLTNFFKKDRGPETQSVTFGIGLILN